jgi:hypothetical protein
VSGTRYVYGPLGDATLTYAKHPFTSIGNGKEYTVAGDDAAFVLHFKQ